MLVPTSLVPLLVPNVASSPVSADLEEMGFASLERKEQLETWSWIKSYWSHSGPIAREDVNQCWKMKNWAAKGPTKDIVWNQNNQRRPVNQFLIHSRIVKFSSPRSYFKYLTKKCFDKTVNLFPTVFKSQWLITECILHNKTKERTFHKLRSENGFTVLNSMMFSSQYEYIDHTSIYVKYFTFKFKIRGRTPNSVGK